MNRNVYSMLATLVGIAPVLLGARSAYWTQGQYGIGPPVLDFIDAGTISIDGIPAVQVTTGMWCTGSNGRCPSPDRVPVLGQPLFAYRLEFLSSVRDSVRLMIDAPFDPYFGEFDSFGQSIPVQWGVFFEAVQRPTIQVIQSVGACVDEFAYDAGSDPFECDVAIPYCGCVVNSVLLDGPSSSPATFLIDPSRLPGDGSFRPGDVLMLAIRTPYLPLCDYDSPDWLSTCTTSAPMSYSVGDENPVNLGPGYGPSNFTIPVPRLSGVSDQSRLAGQPGFDLRVIASQAVQGVKVRWDGKPLESLYDGGVQITARIPASLISAAGSHRLDLLNPTQPDGGGASAEATPFDVVALGLDPVVGFVDGGTLVNVTGTRFDAGLSVLFDGVPGTGLKVLSPSRLTLATPPHQRGYVTVTVTNQDGPTTSVPSFSYVLRPPQVESLVPTSGLAEGGTPVTISGFGFEPGATVAFGSSLLPATVVSTSEIRVNTPANTPGTVDVAVVNVDGQRSLLPHAFTYQKPGIASSCSSLAGPSDGFLGVFSLSILVFATLSRRRRRSIGHCR